MSRKLVVLVVLLIAVAGAWYAFRPERLFINQKVNEQALGLELASNGLKSKFEPFVDQFLQCGRLTGNMPLGHAGTESRKGLMKIRLKLE